MNGEQFSLAFPSTRYIVMIYMLGSMHPYTEDSRRSIHTIFHTSLVARNTKPSLKWKCLTDGVLTYQSITSLTHASHLQAWQWPVTILVGQSHTNSPIERFWKNLSIQSKEDACHLQNEFTSLAKDIRCPKVDGSGGDFGQVRCRVWEGKTSQHHITALLCLSPYVMLYLFTCFSPARRYFSGQQRSLGFLFSNVFQAPRSVVWT